MHLCPSRGALQDTHSTGINGTKNSSLYYTRTRIRVSLLCLLLLLRRERVVLVDVCRLPGVADPLVTDGPGSDVAASGGHLLGEDALLLFILVLDPSVSIGPK